MFKENLQVAVTVFCKQSKDIQNAEKKINAEKQDFKATVCVKHCVWEFLLHVCTGTTYLNGMALRKMFIGLGPAVYLLIMRGNIIWMGTIGTANNARVSFGIPASISFRPERESAAAKAICGYNRIVIHHKPFIILLLGSKLEIV